MSKLILEREQTMAMIIKLLKKTGIRSIEKKDVKNVEIKDLVWIREPKSVREAVRMSFDSLEMIARIIS